MTAWNDDTPTASHASEPPQYAQQPFRHLRLVYTAGDVLREVRAWQLDGSRVVIGRNRTMADVALPDDQLSRAHCVLELGPEGDYVISDLNSRHGTYVDGDKIVGAAPAKHGTVLRVGGSIFVVVDTPPMLNVPPLVPSRTAATRAQVLFRAEILAKAARTFLILGENGSGKGHLAHHLHENLPVREDGKSRPFVAVNCGSIPNELFERELFGHVRGAFSGAEADQPGLAEQADGGVLFLDEIGDMPFKQQVKLLDLIQDRRIRRVGSTNDQSLDVVVIAATNRNLESMIAAGTFRQDLYFRLREVELTMPPLRDRRDELGMLFDGFLSFGRWLLHAKALEKALLHDWPGNVRELSQVARELMATIPLGGTVRPENVPGPKAEVGLRIVQGEVPEEAQRLIDAAVAAQGNVSEMGRQLGLHRKVVYRMLKEHGLRAANYR